MSCVQPGSEPVIRVELRGFLRGRPHQASSLIGRADVLLPDVGLVILGVLIKRGSEGPRVCLPTSATVRDGKQITKRDGSYHWSPTFVFETPAQMGAFIRAVLAAVRATYPEAFP